MSPQIVRFGMVVICVLALLGCWSRRPPRVDAPAIDPAAAAGAMEQYDANDDGAIDGQELEKAPSLKKALRQIDLNEDGKIRAAEITDRVRQWHDSKLGVATVSCVVRKGGLPLEGAAVTFVPEKFLGPNVQTATGVTDPSGSASVSVPDADPPGVAPGLYLVRITKEGEDIPAKYNTETTLGQEVAIDAEGLATGSPTYELD